MQRARSCHACAEGTAVKALYLISFILQQGLQLFPQHQGAEVRHRHRFGVGPLRLHAVLENEEMVSVPWWGEDARGGGALTAISCRLQGRLVVETPCPGLWE